MSSTKPRIAMTILAIVAVAVVAASVPFDGSDRPLSTPSVTPTETPTGTPTPTLTPSGGGDPLDLGRVSFLGLLAVLLVGAVAVLYRTLSNGPVEATDPDQSRIEPSTADPYDVDLEAVGDAAGRTADRLERYGTSDNEVYRAWTTMTDHLRVHNRHSRTPGELAAAAERAGMDGSDVGELTELFESVRYGGREPSETEEDRAVELLRRIESRYAGDRE